MEKIPATVLVIFDADEAAQKGDSKSVGIEVQFDVASDFYQDLEQQRYHRMNQKHGIF